MASGRPALLGNTTDDRGRSRGDAAEGRRIRLRLAAVLVLGTPTFAESANDTATRTDESGVLGRTYQYSTPVLLA